MEPFVRRIVAGGLATVGGLWILALLDTGTQLWLIGLLLVLGGGVALLVGIAQPLTGRPNTDGSPGQRWSTGPNGPGREK